ncbi:hypothetical protein GJ496_011521 [Pomphorhynchus laevis]|nr:hypothetical protein GJ496_011521 [Pomphorhynchus laevis]
MIVVIALLITHVNANCRFYNNPRYQFLSGCFPLGFVNSTILHRLSECFIFDGKETEASIESLHITHLDPDTFKNTSITQICLDRISNDGLIVHIPNALTRFQIHRSQNTPVLVLNSTVKSMIFVDSNFTVNKLKVTNAYWVEELEFVNCALGNIDLSEFNNTQHIYLSTSNWKSIKLRNDSVPDIHIYMTVDKNFKRKINAISESNSVIYIYLTGFPNLIDLDLRKFRSLYQIVLKDTSINTLQIPTSVRNIIFKNTMKSLKVEVNSVKHSLTLSYELYIGSEVKNWDLWCNNIVSRHRMLIPDNRQSVELNCKGTI